MKIAYVGKHDSGGNDDEGAILFALENLGHEVTRITESHTKGVSNLRSDFLLCHHWHDLFALRQVKIPKVFWCFDLVDWPDKSTRHSQRKKWMTELTSICDLGFLTDGDWVAKDTSGKLHWLTQGADERPCEGTFEVSYPLQIKEGAVGPVYKPDEYEFLLDNPQVIKPIDVLFVGSLGYGRESFVRELRERYGEKFKHIAKGCHGVALANEINRAKIVVAPDSPVTEKYWSNRIYNMMRLGAFLVHPYIKNLMDQVDCHGWWYGDREGMFGIIDDWIPRDKSREELTRRSQEIILSKHTYYHRCASLIQTVKEKLSI